MSAPPFPHVAVWLESIATKQQLRTPPVIAGGLPEGLGARARATGGGAACSPVSRFAQASGWLRIGKRCERCGCHDHAAHCCRSAAGFRRRALFWKVDAGFSQPNMIDVPVANMA